MTEPTIDTATVRQLIHDAIVRGDFQRATFGGKARSPQPIEWLRVIVRPVEIRGTKHVQFEYFDQTKCVTKNHLPHEATKPLDELIALGYAGVHITTATEEIDIHITKKGRIQIGRRKVATPISKPEPHNRTKELTIPEGRRHALLEALGVLARDGQVRPTKRSKFTQINEFLKHLKHTLDVDALRALNRPVEILDCGCGSSQLTLMAHHTLNEEWKIPARIIGVDVNEEVIRKSAARADRIGSEGVVFSCGFIDALAVKPDIVFALHACNTATDDALAVAIRNTSQYVFAVPCCHNHLNEQFNQTGSPELLQPIFRHGIMHQRMADIVTDTFRALILRLAGYRADIVEFISPEHTARNLLIRATYIGPVTDERIFEEYRTFRAFWGVTPYLETALGETFPAILRKSTT